MIRDINEIQALATKYSKQQLSHMAQLGLIDPTKAVMAGMMITRIEQQNAKPPQTTVAQDVLGLQSVANQPALNMQAQQMPEGKSGGVAMLPSNITEMATGGIVAFDEGGEVPGYAGGSLIEPEFRTNDPRQIAQAKWNILSEQLAANQQVADASEGDEKLRAMSNIQQIQNEMRPLQKILGKGAQVSGITSLIPSAEAGEMKPAKTAQAKQETSSPLGRFFSDLVSPSPEAVSSFNRQRDIDRKILEKTEQINKLGGTFGLQQQTPDQQRQYDQLKAELQALYASKRQAPSMPAAVAEQKAQEAYPAKAWSDVTDRLKTAAPAGITSLVEPQGDAAANVTQTGLATGVAPSASQAAASPSFEMPQRQALPAINTDIQVEPTKKPEMTTVEAEQAKREQHYRDLGIDPDMYKNLIAKQDEKRAKLGETKKEALGLALMQAGFGLMGARKGQEFQALSSSAKEALSTYQGAIKDIKASEDKIDEARQALVLAENQYKKTGADADLAKVEERRREIANLEAQDIKSRNEAKVKSMELATHVYGYDRAAAAQELASERHLIGTKYSADQHKAATEFAHNAPSAQLQMVNQMLADMRTRDPKATFVDAYNAYAGQGKTGVITDDDIYKDWSKKTEKAKELGASKAEKEFAAKYPDWRSYAKYIRGSGSVGAPVSTEGWGKMSVTGQ